MKPPGSGSLPSRFTGRRQALALTILGSLTTIAASLSLVLPDPGASWAGAVAVTLVVASPLLRVAWLSVRWLQEDDWRFASLAGVLLAIVALGALLAT